MIISTENTKKMEKVKKERVAIIGTGKGRLVAEKSYSVHPLVAEKLIKKGSAKKAPAKKGEKE